MTTTTEQSRKNHIAFLNEYWGKQTTQNIAQSAEKEYQPISLKQFISNCQACGGNWGGMLLTGIHKLYPSVWEAIPDDMGPAAFTCIMSVLTLCGVSETEE